MQCASPELPTDCRTGAVVSTQEIGNAAEAHVALLLEAEGQVILDRNWRVRGGELDIVALHERVLTFVEVRARTGTLHGASDESVGPRKLRTLLRAAQAWLAAHPDYQECFWHVDLFAVTLDRNGAVQRMARYENLTLDEITRPDRAQRGGEWS